ncbi:unnamed protein product [Schistosoma curassoni]|uniref:Uncharacterized protein n=1 Tax=Schistosoma curassoni TaxID=6186 RepID=A0A183KW55_9TREM|nr:unnamed protein product [Schistosoma curassoni]
MGLNSQVHPIKAGSFELFKVPSSFIIIPFKSFTRSRSFDIIS